MAEQQIFRRVSLERLSTPEQLDHLMQVTTPKGWYALWTLCGILLIALVWSVVGSLPTDISGPALIMPPRGVDDVYAPAAGVIREVLVKEGDLVEAGDVVARMEQKEMEEKGTRSKSEIELKLAATRSRIIALEKGAQSKREALALGLIAPSELDSTDNALASARSELKSLQKRLGVTTVYVTHDQVEAMSLGDRIAVLHDNRVEQVGTPSELYDKPATAFVGQFIGTPPMNLLPARLVRQGDAWAAAVGAITLPLPAAKTAAVQASGAGILLGVRPESIALGRAGGGKLSGLVQSVEPLGRETTVRLLVEGQSLAVVTGRSDLAAGQSVGVSFPAEACHVFPV